MPAVQSGGLAAPDLFTATADSRSAAEQLAFDLPVDDRMRPEDYLVAPCNQLAFAALSSWPDWPDPVLVVCGPAGSGKTHLARIWAERSAAVWLPTPLPDLAGESPGLLDRRAWVVDGAERAGDEVSLFHLINVARACRGGLLLTSRWPPAQWSPRLPDLRSRLLGAHMVRIEPVDDQLLAAVLVKQFADRQLRVEPAVLEYLCRHMERSFAAARDVVRLMDRLALAQSRSPTMAIARQALTEIGMLLPPTKRTTAEGG